MIDLLPLQKQSGFCGRCFTCGNQIPPDRLLRGADTCKPECQSTKRRAQRRFQRLVQLHRLLASPAARKLARTEERSARNVSEGILQ